MYMSKVVLRSTERGGTGALASFLASNAGSVGRSHHLVWSLFEDYGGERKFLYRLTGENPLKPILVYSLDKPQDKHALWDIKTQEFGGELCSGMRVSWSLRVNPRVTHNGKKHDLVMNGKRGNFDEGWNEAAQRLVPTWLSPRLSALGIDAPETGMEVEAYNRRRFSRNGSRSEQVIITETDVRGVGTITNSDVLRSSLLTGIGGGKAYGCGMLLVRSF